MPLGFGITIESQYGVTDQITGGTTTTQVVDPDTGSGTEVDLPQVVEDEEIPPDAPDVALTPEARTIAGLKFQNPFGVDFDSESWTIGERADRFGNGIDIYVGTLARAAVGTFDQALAVEGPPDRTKCESSTVDRWSGYVPRDRFKQGKSFCLQTSDGGWAWIDVVSFVERSDDGYGLTELDVTYWRG